jgi:outer membrane protein assembly factor BamB
MKKILKTVLYLLPFVIVLALGWWLVRWMLDYRPLIDQIPLREPGAELVILGRRFGAGAGQGKVTLTAANPQTGQTTTINLPIQTWTGERISVRLPREISHGDVRVSQETPLGRRESQPRAFVTRVESLSSKSNHDDIPVQEDAPWPVFRHDGRNTGRAPLRGNYSGDQPWQFQTAKGIFSTPVIDRNCVIYVGSADHYFYAVNPDGKLQWKYETGEIIDSAAALGRPDPTTGVSPVTFISGDGNMYHFRTGPGLDAASRSIWKFHAELQTNISFNNWFEGNVAIGPDGTLYAGNTNFNYYAVNPDGTQRWIYPTTSNNWSMAAFGPDGSIYWGSVDTAFRRVDPGGRELWKTSTLGFVAASAAVGSDGVVYISSFDSNLYALDPLSGAVRWKFPTSDHIYASAALGQDAKGRTNRIYIGSADGFLYAVNPDGKLAWKFDSGDVIRSSPAIGLDADGAEILYFGNGSGRLYAIHALDGSLRWSFNTTPLDNPELVDRNDLNGSPALGKTGVYIGGEHGLLVYVPYDYCLNDRKDSRCATTLPAAPDGARLRYVTSGGNALDTFPEVLPVSTNLTLQLSVHKNGESLLGRVCNSPIGCSKDALQINFDPPLAHHSEHSSDGRYIYILPDEYLIPGATYHLSVRGDLYTGGLRLGNLTLGGSKTGRFDQSFTFKTEDASTVSSPFSIRDDSTFAVEWTRLAAPIPPMLPSLNQIGFDYMDWIVGTIRVGEPDANGRSQVLLWSAGGRRDTSGRLVIDPQTDFLFPLFGSAYGESFILENRDFKMPITGISIPFNRFQIRGRLGLDGLIKPGASVFADTRVLDIPKFGPYLVIAGLANNWYEKMLVSGTYTTHPYPADSPANRRPAGISAGEVTFTSPDQKNPGRVRAAFKLAPGASYPLAEHLPALLLVDADTGRPVSLDYRLLLKPESDSQGSLASITLTIPAGTKLPAHLRAYLILDVYPLASSEFTVTTK